ncbi:Uncharacterised protein [uncultured Comamonas sp.]|nr:Uncharacterised protein [uncultured Comamonas sp.]
MNINNIKISTKLLIGFGLMAVLLFFISSASLWKAKNLHDDFESVMLRQYPKVIKIEEIKDLLNTNEVSISHMLHYKESASHEDLIGKVLATREKIAQALQFLESQEMGEEEAQSLAAFKQPRLDYIETQDRYIELIRDNRLDDALFLLILEMPNKRNEYHAALKNLVDVQTTLMNRSMDVAKDSVTNMYWVIGTVTILVLVGATILSLWIIRSITRPIADAMRVADAVADGKLTQDITAVGKSETARLLLSLKQMQAGLVQVVGRVRQGSEGIATASAQISQSNQDLSARTEHQASALQQTTATMEQLNATVRQNAASAQQADKLSQKAREVAAQGGQAMESVVRTMREIETSASRIGDIIGVIDAIAFQTNILALNAAVEAARAGEQGRGFAVVASEVRALAGRSADAAREIKQLIHSSMGSVQAGTKEVDQTGQIMAEVVQSIAQVAQIMEEITAASSEQSQGVAQVNQSVVQMDQTTQQNAALVEEMAAAALSLSQQAQELVRTVAVFDLGNAAPPPSRAANDGEGVLALSA